MKLTYTLCFTLFIYCMSIGQSCDINGVIHATFADISMILDTNGCGNCHNGGQRKGAWSYDSYKSLHVSGDCKQPVLVHGNASASFLYNRLADNELICGESNDIHHLPEEDLDKIESWINFGALENCMPFYEDVKFILDNQNCNSCHSGTTAQVWSYDTYSDMLQPSTLCQDRQNVVKGNAHQSLLFDKINEDGQVTCGETMHGENGPLSYKEISTIRDWINGGALESVVSLP